MELHEYPRELEGRIALSNRRQLRIRTDGQLSDRLMFYTKPKLLIID